MSYFKYMYTCIYKFENVIFMFSIVYQSARYPACIYWTTSIYKYYQKEFVINTQFSDTIDDVFIIIVILYIYTKQNLTG